MKNGEVEKRENLIPLAIIYMANQEKKKVALNKKVTSSKLFNAMSNATTKPKTVYIDLNASNLCVQIIKGLLSA